MFIDKMFLDGERTWPCVRRSLAALWGEVGSRSSTNEKPVGLFFFMYSILPSVSSVLTSNFA